jgi:hypothetical protein
MTTQLCKPAPFAACLLLGCASATWGTDRLPDASGTGLPDWSGWWGQGDAPTKSYIEHPPPLRPEKLKELARRKPGEIGRDLYCHAATFTGINGNFAVNFEFLFTPGRVTITNESGVIRRIYTDGRPLPAHPEPSSSGTSVGHWEGQTLVVETVGISPDAQLARFGPIGKNVRIVEHIRLKESEVLQTELDITAPDIFAAPDRRTYLSGRVPGKRAPVEANWCNARDRSYDSKSGQERFDMTPPADLPPPPGR